MAVDRKHSNDKHRDAEDLASIALQETYLHDAVFGEVQEGGVNYRSIGWLGAAGLMMKTQIGLGVLSFPAVLDTLGMIPGVVSLLAVAGITTWSDYMVGVFKVNHRHVYGVDDAGQLMFGRIGKEVLAVAFLGQYVLTAGSALLSVSIALNALSDHAMCTAGFVAVVFVVVFAFASVRTLSRMSWLAIVGVVSIITAIIIVMIGVGVQDQPPTAPTNVPWKTNYKLVGNPSFTEAVTAISTLIFAYAGTGAFFSIVSEMKDPRQYPQALGLCQGIITAVYLMVAVVVYYFCGSYVASPAMGSAGRIIKKVAYGVALPGLLVSGILLTHVSSKYIFVRVLRGSRHLTTNTVTHWATWLACTFGVATVAYVMASTIPVFNGIVSLTGALFGTMLTMQPMGCMWLYDNWTKGRDQATIRWRLMVAWCGFVIIVGTFMTVTGTYGTIVGIVNSYRKNGGVSAFACADNSISS